MGFDLAVQEGIGAQAFKRLIPNIGRSYHSQAIQLVELCRLCHVKTDLKAIGDQWRELAL
jgi:hypothetical protein